MMNVQNTIYEWVRHGDEQFSIRAQSIGAGCGKVCTSLMAGNVFEHSQQGDDIKGLTRR
jgi:hypothetical protein